MMAEAPCAGIVGLHEARDEDERLYSWYMHRSLELGFGVSEAEEIAHGRLDLHELEELIGSGCELETALAIVR
jgi:hypothetical protein